MTIQGVRLTDNFVTDARPQNWREGILLLFPNGKAPLFALSAGMRKRSTDDPQFNWWEKTMPTHRIALTADALIGATTLTVGSSGGVNNAVIAGIKQGTVMRVEQSEELIFVDANPVSGGTTISVLRGWANTTAFAIDFDGAGANPNLHSVGNQMPENSPAPSGISFDPVKKSNYTQIFRDTLEMSRTAQKTRLRTGNQVREAKRETLELHSAQIEKATWFGNAYDQDVDPINGNITRSTGGIFGNDANGTAFIPAANVVDVAAAPLSGAFDMDDVETWLEQAFRFGSQEKIGFCGNAAMLQIQQVIRKTTGVSYELIQGQKEFGMDVRRLVSPFGTVVLKTHPLFNQIVGGTTAATAYTSLNSWLAILDMDEFVYRYIDDTSFESKLETNGLDGMKSGYITECGFEIHHPSAHFLIKNLQGAN